MRLVTLEKLLAGMAAVLFTLFGYFVGVSQYELADTPEPIIQTIISENRIVEYREVEVPHIVKVEVVQEVERLPETILTDEEKDLIARVVMAEAGNQDYIGKRLVADVILNRVQQDGFGSTVIEVVYAEDQFATPASSYTDDCLAAVEAECYERLDYNILWFCNYEYLDYGEPAYKHGDHYFSWVKEVSHGK